MNRKRFQEEESSPSHEMWLDDLLLKSWLSTRDEGVFRILVERHERMVREICRCVLRHRQDAEDAAQETFLVLMRKAEMIEKGASLGSWLHGVAYRVATTIRRGRKRRENHEVSSADGEQPVQPLDEVASKEFEDLIIKEVRQLPEKFQASFVLHCLEGKSKAETAAELGLKEGTVASRVRKARELLRFSLAHYGIPPPRQRGQDS